MNPFVWNEYFFSNVTNLPYYKTTSYFIHLISNFASFSVGIFLIGLLSYCISEKTPPNFKPYSRMLWLCVMADSIILFVDFMYQIRVKIYGSIFLMHVSGPISFLVSHQTLPSILCIMSFAAMLGTSALVAQFYYRYKTIKNDTPPSFLKTCLYFLLAVILLLPVTIAGFFAYNTDVKDLPFIDYGHVWEIPMFKLQLLLIIIVNIICYTSVLILARKSIAELMRQSTNLTQRQKSLQRQFSRTLIGQLLSPIIFLMIPITLAATTLFLKFSRFEYFGEFVVLSISWYPELSPLSSLIFIVPYWRFWMEKFFGIRPKNNTTITFMNQSLSTSQNTDAR